MSILRTWQDLPKETLLKAFEAGNFAGVEEMKRNDRLFERVAPMGVNDIMMAVQYRWDIAYCLYGCSAGFLPLPSFLDVN